ncbi:MAG: ketol-acid reductoisomerase [Myxococcota bacterium]
MTTLYDSKDLSKDALQGTTIAVIGYGSQGRAHALNLRDTGHTVLVGLRPGGESWSQAVEDGWEPTLMAEAVAAAEVVALLVPDPVQPALFEAVVAPNLTDGTLLLFAHGFNVHFKQLTVPDHVDVGLVAPKGPGGLVRRQFEEGRGVPSLVAVEQDVTGKALERTLSYAHGLGAARAAVLSTTFAEETETDLFGEQAVLCGGATELVTAGWETLVEAGYSPEVAYFECLHELKLIVDLLYEGGLGGMHKYISETASYGDLTQGGRVVDDRVRARMRGVLADIQSGQFARAWREENERGRERYETLLAEDLAHPIEAVGAQLRARMPWLHQPSAS